MPLTPNDPQTGGGGGGGTGGRSAGGLPQTPPNAPTQNVPKPSTGFDPYNAATVGKREPPYRNHPIASALSLPPSDLTGQPLQRGYLIEDPVAGDVIPLDQRYRLDFHFNPETINETWDVDFSQDSANLQSDPLPAVIRPKGVSFSWSIICDRTRFEQQVPEGVMNDARIMAKILTRGVGGADSNMNSLLPAPVKVVFGPGGVGTNFAQSWFAYKGKPLKNQWIKSPLGATGLMLSYDIQYTRFNKLMVPVRAVMDITIRVNYWMPSQSTDPTGANAAAAASTRGAAAPGLPPNTAWNKVPPSSRPS